MTQLLQIANALKAALNTGRPAGVPEAKFWSGIQLESTDLPARTVVWTEESTERANTPTSPLSSRKVTFLVQDVAAGTGEAGQTPQEVCEAFRAWSISALVGNRYGGLAIDTVEMRTSWEHEQGEEPFVRMTHQFDVQFTTRANNAEQRA